MDRMMEHEFSRTELLIGEEGIRRLNSASVLVFGLGGVGAHCVEALARCGIGKLTLVDPDTVSLSNINRQCVAFHSTVGEYKTAVMKRIIADISPEVAVMTHETFVLPDNIDEIFTERPDYVIDAVDTVTAKLAIVQKAEEYGVPVISCMGTGNKLYGDLFEIADLSETSVCPLCRVMRRELKKRGIEHLKVLYSKEVPVSASTGGAGKEERQARPLPGSISFVPPVAGLLIAGEAVRDMIKDK